MHQPLAKGFPRLGFLQIDIILLAVITALIHLYLGVSNLMMGRGGPLPLLFLLNFLCFVHIASLLIALGY